MKLFTQFFPYLATKNIFRWQKLFANINSATWQLPVWISITAFHHEQVVPIHDERFDANVKGLNVSSHSLFGAGDPPKNSPLLF